MHPSAINLQTYSYFTLEELRAAYSYTYSNGVQERVKCSSTYRIVKVQIPNFGH
jgi:hypothetical protein